MNIVLNPIECRVLGSLVEKDMTTPDYYPLSLNALQNACNQKSNRQPVLSLQEEEIIGALDRLRHLGVAMQSRDGGRVAKFSHTLREKLHLDETELAILTELLLRGPQTPGELRARADRMAKLESLETTEGVLTELIERETPLVVKLPRQTGRKECRYMHLLGDTEPAEETSTEPEISQPPHRQDETIELLELEITTLRQELEDLRSEFEEFKNQFS